MAKLIYSKRNPKKFKASDVSSRHRVQKEPLPPPPADSSVMRSGTFEDTPYEIVYTSISGGMSYSVSKPCVCIAAAVDKLTPEKAQHVIEYACKCRVFYVEYHDSLEPSQRMSVPKGRQYASEKAFAWLSEKIGQKQATALLKSFSTACVKHAKDMKRLNAKYDEQMRENFYLRQTITDDEQTDRNDPWELDV